MNIVIVGAGKVGELLCVELSREDHSVSLIEKDAGRLEQLINMSDITGFEGNGAMLESQIEAGVRTADVFIAVTPVDETNIIAAITAKKIGARYSIARVRSPEYSLQMQFLRESLGINVMINPELEASRDIARLLRFPKALSVEYFDHGRVNFIETEIAPGSPLKGCKLCDLTADMGNVLVCLVIREDSVIIPDGQTELAADDRLFITGSDEEIAVFTDNCTGIKRRKSIRKALIVGGGRLTRYVLPRLDRMGIFCKVIEVDPRLADEMAAEFPGCEVISGDGTSQTFLREERIQNYDVVMSLTGIDEENLLISIFAAHEGVPKTITKVNRTDLLGLLENTGLQSIITPRRVISDQIIRLIRSLANSEGSNVEAFYRLADGRAELLEFHVAPKCRACNIPLQALNTKPGLLLACLIRDDKVIYPRGQDRLLPGDDVIVITVHPNFHDLEDILA